MQHKETSTINRNNRRHSTLNLNHKRGRQRKPRRKRRGHNLNRNLGRLFGLTKTRQLLGQTHNLLKRQGPPLKHPLKHPRSLLPQPKRHKHLEPHP